VTEPFAEYVPVALLIIAMAEYRGVAPFLVHACALCLSIDRLLHAFGVSREPEISGMRVGGMALTFIAILIATALNLWIAAASILI